MAETATSTTYTYCGEPEPTDACERGGWCDYHLGAMPSGPSPWDLGQIVAFEVATDAEYAAHLAAVRVDLGFGDEPIDPEGGAPYDDGGRQSCGCSPEFHGARCTGPR